MLRHTLFAAVLLSALVWSASPAGAESIRDTLEVRQLDNGLTVLVYPRPELPTFAGRVLVDAGSSDEHLGITGVAHMFEHMAFKGTETIGALDYQAERAVLDEIDRVAVALTRLRAANEPDPDRIAELEARYAELKQRHDTMFEKNAFDEIYKRAGGRGLNATTSRDFTNYFIELPANRLELWMWMESDRLLHPVMREFYTERDVIIEERNMRVENNPQGKFWELFFASAYQTHPYGYPILGWPEDMARLTRDKALDFREQHYRPGRMTIALVGSVDPDEAFALAERYFGRLPAGEPGLTPPPPAERPQAGERRFEARLPSNPLLMIGYHKQPLPHGDDLVADVLGDLLSDGRSSRLYKSLVLEQQLATGVWAFTTPGDKYENLFMLYAVPRAPHTVEEVEQALYAELERLAEEGPSERELQRVRNQLEADYLRGLRSNSGLAYQLTAFHALTGDPYYIDRYLEQLMAVDAAQVQEFIRRVLVPENRTVGWITTVEPEPATAQAADTEQAG